MAIMKLRSVSLLFALMQTKSAFAADDDKDNKKKTPDNNTSRLQVHVPQSLYKADGYEHREALFGVPPYGASIAQNVYYADSDLCDGNVDTHRGYPEREQEDGQMAPWPSPFILMVDRGGCSFVQKVRNAQRAGAAGVVIADNKCLCMDKECIAENRANSIDEMCQSAEPIMADDGSGGDISIPSFLMFKTDAAKIINELKDNQMVQIEMSWSLPKPDDRVEYDLWTVPSNPVSKEFEKNWMKFADALGEHAYFTPHQYVYDGIKSHCQGNDGENMCYNLCTNNGRYCATDPDNDLEKGISGADVVKESLRRICIWKHYGEESGIGEVYWKYIKEFTERCDSEKYFMNEDCAKDAIKHADIDYSRVTRCMDDSGGLDADKSNSMLDYEIDAQTKRGVVVLPTAFVNTVPLRGMLTATSVFNAICAGFLDGTQPDICKTCAGCPDVSTCVSNRECEGAYTPEGVGRKGVSKRVFALSLLGVCTVFGAAGYLHWKKTREDMREQVRGILAEYMPLDGGEEDSNPMDFASNKNDKASLMS